MILVRSAKAQGARMPVYGAIDVARHIVTLRFTGETSYAEWEQVMDDILANVAYVVGMCVLSDRRAAENIPSTQHIRDLVAYLVRHAESFVGCGVAIVARTEVEFGMSRMAEILAEETGVLIRAFHTVDEARTWLALTHPR